MQAAPNAAVPPAAPPAAPNAAAQGAAPNAAAQGAAPNAAAQAAARRTRAANELAAAADLTRKDRADLRTNLKYINDRKERQKRKERFAAALMKTEDARRDAKVKAKHGRITTRMLAYWNWGENDDEYSYHPFEAVFASSVFATVAVFIATAELDTSLQLAEFVFFFMIATLSVISFVMPSTTFTRLPTHSSHNYFLMFSVVYALSVLSPDPDTSNSTSKNSMALVNDTRMQVMGLGHSYSALLVFTSMFISMFFYLSTSEDYNEYHASITSLVAFIAVFLVGPFNADEAVCGLRATPVQVSS
jgi:hypothetical protein